MPTGIGAPVRTPSRNASSCAFWPLSCPRGIRGELHPPAAEQTAARREVVQAQHLGVGEQVQGLLRELGAPEVGVGDHGSGAVRVGQRDLQVVLARGATAKTLVGSRVQQPAHGVDEVPALADEPRPLAVGAQVPALLRPAGRR